MVSPHTGDSLAGLVDQPLPTSLIDAANQRHESNRRDTTVSTSSPGRNGALSPTAAGGEKDFRTYSSLPGFDRAIDFMRDAAGDEGAT